MSEFGKSESGTGYIVFLLLNVLLIVGREALIVYKALTTQGSTEISRNYTYL